ncbi:hypothetical protein KBC79_03450, partial [Candidatus Woesebacteria bacterium]|nr:hypothetical protein [Candidatus Woesebacteria bacterium]
VKHGIRDQLRLGIGYYPMLRQVYNEAFDHVTRRNAKRGLQPTAVDLEHQAVLLAARWYVTGAEFNLTYRSLHSPYNSYESGTGIREITSWARLGERVQKQLQGMRQKIRGVDLSEIGRFIGKSGESKEGKELRWVRAQLKQLENDSPGQLDDLVQRQNEKDIQYQREIYQDRREVLLNQFKKWSLKILERELPESEVALQQQSVVDGFHEKSVALQDELLAKIQELEMRTTDQLITELRAKEADLEKKCNSKKSLAQKALDLHFVYDDYHREKTDDFPANLKLGKVIDWINHASFGTIKRTHRALEQGVSKTGAFALAATEMIAGRRGVTRGEYDVVLRMVENCNDREARIKLTQMCAFGNILSANGYQVSFEQIEQLAHSGLAPRTFKLALKYFSLDEVTLFAKLDIKIDHIVRVKERADAAGRKLSYDELTKLAGYEYLTRGLDAVLRSGWEWKDIYQVLDAGQNLSKAHAVSIILANCGHRVSTRELCDLISGIEDIQDFSQAAANLNFGELTELTRLGVRYEQYRDVTSILRKHEKKLGFAKTVELSSMTSAYELEGALKWFTYEEVLYLLEHKRAKDTKLSGMVSVSKILRESDVKSTLDDLFWFVSSWQNRSFILDGKQLFGTDDLLKLVRSGATIQQAILAKKKLEEESLPTDFEVILQAAKCEAGVDVVIDAISAGFSIDEIKQYPYIASPLLAN